MSWDMSWEQSDADWTNSWYKALGIKRVVVTSVEKPQKTACFILSKDEKPEDVVHYSYEKVFRKKQREIR